MAKTQKLRQKKDKADEDPAIEQLLRKGTTDKIPSKIKPMLATLVNEPFDNSDWTYEVKWDGYRAIAYINEGNVELLSRNNKSFIEKYYPIAEQLGKWSINAVIDGEIIVMKENGTADFSALQNWRSEADGYLVFYVFDLLWYNGTNIMELPLFERQAILKAILPKKNDQIRISDVFTGSGLELFAAAKKMGLEGIMAKKVDGVYSPDSRTKQWLKIKANKRQEVVIGGYTNNEGSSKAFSSLLLGVFKNGDFEYVGKVGTGFSDKLQKEMILLFNPLKTQKNPFSSDPDINKPSRFRPNPPHATATWLKPELVCEVSYAEITSDGVFRHPSFEGIRTDKKASEVIREIESSSAAVVKSLKAQKGIVSAPEKSGRRSLLNPKEETQVKKVKGHELKFSNLSKVYWPEEGYTKRDVFNYYYQMAEYILPYLKDRPQSLHRFPGGIYGKSFYQKDVRGKAPDWVETFPYTTSEGENKEFLVGGDEATLLWMASLGCIEMNPWFSRTDNPDNPDYCVIDLDPDQNTFEQVIQTALEVKNILDELGIKGYAKTSGSTGIHIYIPLASQYTYDQSQLFAKLIVSMVHERLSEFTTMERQIKNRGGKMYLDFLQNRPGATIACPYSLRPKPGATVSTPLHWDEVKKGLQMKDFTIKNAIVKVREQGDIFQETLGKGINMIAALQKAQSL